MRAVRVVGYHEDLQMHDVPDPKISGPLDVIVKIGAAGVCRTDLHILEGQWAPKTNVPLPYTIGHENAGWVHEVGSAVTNVKPGDKVILHPIVTGVVMKDKPVADVLDGVSTRLAPAAPWQFITGYYQYRHDDLWHPGNSRSIGTSPG